MTMKRRLIIFLVSNFEVVKIIKNLIFSQNNRFIVLSLRHQTKLILFGFAGIGFKSKI